MNGWTYAYMVVGLLFAVAPASALIPDSIEIRTSPEWLTAGSGDTATITVQVVNSSTGNASFPGVAIDFTVNKTYGGISPAQAVTNDAGMAKAFFTPATRSGAVTITAGFSYQGREVSNATVCRVDHAAPHTIANLWYEPEVMVGQTMPIVVRMVDEYGNTLDNRREAEIVRFMVGSSEGGTGAVFIGGTDEISVPVDANGNATATLRVNTAAGENIVFVTFPGDIGSRYLTVKGLANGEPSAIYQTVSPKVENPGHYPELPLGEQFSIIYALYDEYGNVAGDREIKVDVRSVAGSLTSGEWFITTNSQGKAQITYGPSDRAGVVEIAASAVDNSSVSCTQKVGFYSTTPTDMLLTAVPQTIASGDVKSDLVSRIKAKVMDSKGNPVRNETVSFRIVDIDDGGYFMTDGPEISNGIHTSGEIGASLVTMTDEHGFATIEFHPGAFTRDTSDPGYSGMASGSATIQAAWNDRAENTTVSFRNYPYLSVNVSVDPPVVVVNDSVNVTVQLIGDGWALQSRPIDVVLCTDRSGSMLQNTTYGGGWSDKYPDWVKQESIDDRMVHAMEAAKAFVSQMQPLKDRIGLVSFGQDGTADLDRYSYTYWAGNDYSWGKRWFLGDGWVFDDGDDSAYISRHYINPQDYRGPATRDLNLTSTYEDANTTIDNWLPCGGTPMREGLYQSVRMICDHPRTGDPVKAIVLLTDGAWNTGGDPEGGDGAKSFPGVGKGSVISYAKASGIKIFTIALGNEPNHDELRSYAEQTGGTFYSATAGDDLTRVYEDIATKLQEAAGVDIMMDLAFDRVTINSTPASGVFRYEHNGLSTREDKYWMNNKTSVGEVGEWPRCYDQSNDWNDQILSFDVGDIYLDQTWETTFCLKVLKEGSIDIFGSDSRIRFNGTQGETELGLPHTYITARLSLNETEIATPDIRLDSLKVNADDRGTLVPSWNLTYTGNRSVVQEVMYQFSQDGVWWDGAWHVADTKRHPSNTNVNGTYSSHLDFGDKDGWCKIRITAWEDIPEGVSDEVTCTDITRVEVKDRAYIKIG